MRFLVDVVTQFTLLAIIGYWSILQSPTTSKFFTRAINILILVSLIASFLLSISSETGRIEKHNPALLEQINSIILSR
jgi:hypothetical protein